MRVWMLGKFSFVVDRTMSSDEVLSMLKDDRVKEIHTRSIFAEEDFSDVLG
jgi:hypothetical protein